MSATTAIHIPVVVHRERRWLPPSAEDLLIWKEPRISKSLKGVSQRKLLRLRPRKDRFGYGRCHVSRWLNYPNFMGTIDLRRGRTWLVLHATHSRWSRACRIIVRVQSHIATQHDIAIASVASSNGYVRIELDFVVGHLRDTGAAWTVSGNDSASGPECVNDTMRQPV
jgi:hypothetical protein